MLGTISSTSSTSHLAALVSTLDANLDTLALGSCMGQMRSVCSIPSHWRWGNFQHSYLLISSPLHQWLHVGFAPQGCNDTTFTTVTDTCMSRGNCLVEPRGRARYAFGHRGYEILAGYESFCLCVCGLGLRFLVSMGVSLVFCIAAA